MRSMWRGDRGGSAIEAALLIAAVALVMVPALFFLGRAVDEAFSKPCDDLSDDACASPRAAAGSGGGGGGGSGGGEGPSAPTSARSARPTTSTTGWPNELSA